MAIFKHILYCIRKGAELAKQDIGCRRKNKLQAIYEVFITRNCNANRLQTEKKLFKKKKKKNTCRDNLFSTMTTQEWIDFKTKTEWRAGKKPRTHTYISIQQMKFSISRNVKTRCWPHEAYKVINISHLKDTPTHFLSSFFFNFIFFLSILFNSILSLAHFASWIETNVLTIDNHKSEKERKKMFKYRQINKWIGAQLIIQESFTLIKTATATTRWE